MGKVWFVLSNMLKASLLMFFTTLISGAILFYTFGFDNKIAFYMFIVFQVLFNVYVMQSMDNKVYPVLYPMIFQK